MCIVSNLNYHPFLLKSYKSNMIRWNCCVLYLSKLLTGKFISIRFKLNFKDCFELNKWTNSYNDFFSLINYYMNLNKLIFLILSFSLFLYDHGCVDAVYCTCKTQRGLASWAPPHITWVFYYKEKKLTFFRFFCLLHSLQMFAI